MIGAKARENPFTTTRVRLALPFDPAWLGSDWESLEARLEASGRRVAVVGPHGSGKTTFLATLAERLGDQGKTVRSVLLNNERRRLPEADWSGLQRESDAGVIILVDGFEQLSWVARARLNRVTRNADALIVTSHRRTRFPTLLKTATKVAMFQQFVQCLAPSAPWTAEELEVIFKQCQGNVREALWVCYDRYAAG